MYVIFQEGERQPRSEFSLSGMRLNPRDKFDEDLLRHKRTNLRYHYIGKRGREENVRRGNVQRGGILSGVFMSRIKITIHTFLNTISTHNTTQPCRVHYYHNYIHRPHYLI